MTQLGFGVVEGFYGPPWSHAARLSMIRFLAEVGLDTYVRAPKDDRDKLASPKQRLGTRALDELRELAEVGASVGVRVGCAASPEHVGDLAHVGMRTFMVGYDDTFATFIRPAATFALGQRHAEAAMKALRAAREIDRAAEVVLVPAVYSGRAADLSRRSLAYLEGIAAVASDVPVAWTGPAIFSPVIQPGDVIALERATRLPFFIWNNVIANDWLPLLTGEPLGLRPRQKLCFGPPENMAPGIARVTRGILVNGAREPELTKITLASLADMKREGCEYDPTRSHALAIERIGGPRAKTVLSTVYDWTKNHPFATPSRSEGAVLATAVDGYRRGRLSRDAFLDELAKVGDIARAAREVAAENEAVREALPTIERAARIAKAAAMRAIGARDKASVRALEALLADIARDPWWVGLDAALAFALGRS